MAGLADWACHRRSRIELTSGVNPDTPTMRTRMLDLQVPLRCRDTVEGDDVQPVSVELHQDVVLVLRADDAPALHLGRPHRDGRLALAVDCETGASAGAL